MPRLLALLCLCLAAVSGTPAAPDLQRSDIPSPAPALQRWADYHVSRSAHPILMVMMMNPMYLSVALCYRLYFREVLNMSLAIVFYGNNVSQTKQLLRQTHGIQFFCMLSPDCRPVRVFDSPFGKVGNFNRMPDGDLHFQQTVPLMLSQLKNIRFLVSDADVVWFRMPVHHLSSVLNRYDFLMSGEMWIMKHEVLLNAGIVGGNSSRPGTFALLAAMHRSWKVDQKTWMQGHMTSVLKRRALRYHRLPLHIFSHYPHGQYCGTRHERDCRPPAYQARPDMACYHYVCIILTRKLKCFFDLLGTVHPLTGKCLSRYNVSRLSQGGYLR